MRSKAQPDGRPAVELIETMVLLFTARQHTCYAERCTSYSKSVRLYVCLSVTRWHCVKTTQATITRSSR